MNKILERRECIKNHLSDIILPELTKIICEYDYEIMGHRYELGINNGSIFCIIVLSDHRIVTGSSQGDIKAWDVEKNICVSSFNINQASGSGSRTTRRTMIYCMASIPKQLSNHIPDHEDEHIIIGTCSGSIIILNLRTGYTERSFVAHNQWITGIMVLPDGRPASCSYDGTIKIWNLETCTCDHTFICNQGPVLCMSIINDTLKSDSSNNHFHQDDTENHDPWTRENKMELLIFSKGKDRSLKIWNTCTLVCEKTFDNIHSCDDSCSAGFQSCIIIIKNHKIILGSCDGSIKIVYKKNDTYECLNLIDHRSYETYYCKCVRSICVMDDQRLFTCSGNMIKIFNRITNKCENQFTYDTWITILSCVKLQDGRIVTGSTDNKINIWS